MTKQEQCYVGGPMTGIARLNFDAFDSLAQWLRRNRKWNVFSPVEHDRESWPTIESWDGFAEGHPKHDNYDLATCLSWDLARVAEAQHLVLLPGWEQSTGARHERHVAELTGSSIWLAAPAIVIGGWHLQLDMSRKRRCEGEDIEALERALQPTPTPVAALTGQGGAFVTKDSGERTQLSGGMVRDTNRGKPRYDLIPLLPLRRLAELYARGAEKYEARNWEKACDTDALDRFKESALRHLIQALENDRTEDHWSGAVFNIFGAEWLEAKLNV